MKSIFLQLAKAESSDYYRCLLPARHCEQKLLKDGVLLEAASKREQADAYVLNRWSDMWDEIWPKLRRKQREGAKIVVQLEDDFRCIPDWNPRKPDYLRMRDMIDWSVEVADELWVTVQPLADRFGSKCKVLPNLVDLDDWKSHQRTRPRAKPDDVVRVLWCGSNTHGGDLEVLPGVVDRVAKRFGNRVQWIFWGMPPPAEILVRHFPERVACSEAVSTREYIRCICGLKPDIGVAPLADCMFSQAKSAIKFFEYTLAGAACVLSTSAPYVDAASGKECAQLTVTDESSWANAISELVEDIELRRRYAEKATSLVTLKHSWQFAPEAETWLNAFKNLVK